MDFDTSLEEVNITLGDTGDITFTPEEKTRALTRAWNDKWVVDEVWDTTGTFSINSYQTPVPTALSNIKSIGTTLTASDFPEPIDRSFWDIVDGNIQWTEKARYGITDGAQIYCLGTKKLTVADTIATEALKEYVIALGAHNTLTLLGYKKANLFLKNDTSLGEVIALKRELNNDIQEMRTRFQKSFQDMA